MCIFSPCDNSLFENLSQHGQKKNFMNGGDECGNSALV